MGIIPPMQRESPSVHIMYSVWLNVVEGLIGLHPLLVLLLRMLLGAQREAVIQSVIFHCSQVPIQLESPSDNALC